MMTAAQRFIKQKANYDGYLLAMSVDIYAFVQVRKKGLVATVELSYCIET